MRGLRTMSAGVGAVAMLLGTVGSAGATATTRHAVTETFHDEVPCIGVGSITVVYNTVEHRTTTPGGGDHEGYTESGRFSVLLDAGGTASGRYVIRGELNTADGVTGTNSFTFNGHVSSGVGAGTHWHENAHLTGSLFEASVPVVAFDKFRCR